METLQIIGIIIVFFLLLVLIVLIKRKTGNTLAVSNTDIILALLPIVIFLLLSDKIKSLQFGDLKIETAFKNAQNKNIEKQISEIQFKTLTSFNKGTLFELDEKLKSKPEALKFIVGYPNYDYYVVEEYLRRLSSSTVKYIVFESAGHEFIAMITLYDLNNQLLDDVSQTSNKIRAFTDFLTTNNINALKSLRGILTYENSANETTLKKEALKKMQVANSSFIPVTDNNRKLLGIIEDSKLTSSLLLDISNSINE